MAIDTAKELISTKMVLNISEIIWREKSQVLVLLKILMGELK